MMAARLRVKYGGGPDVCSSASTWSEKGQEEKDGG